jgi:pimeloyl-ACP methyl ester carboxylesterase
MLNRNKDNEAVLPKVAHQDSKLSAADLACKAPCMIVSEVFTLAAGALSSLLCGLCECRPTPRQGAVPILLIHGSGFNQSEWLPLRAYLANDTRIGPTYTVNLGGLCWHDRSSSIHDLAVKRVLPVLERMFSESGGARQAILVGHSMGGLIAAEVAENLSKPGEILKVISICSPFWGAPIMEQAVKICPLQQTDQQMRVESPYLASLRLSILRKDQLGKGVCYYNIGCRMDLLVPGERAVLPLSQLQRCCNYDGIEGHYSVVLSPRVWQRVHKWMLE